MYRDGASGNAPKQRNAARCRSNAGDRSGDRSAGPAAPCPSAYASRFGAEVGNRSPPRTGTRNALVQATAFGVPPTRAR